MVQGHDRKRDQYGLKQYHSLEVTSYPFYYKQSTFYTMKNKQQSRLSDPRMSAILQATTTIFQTKTSKQQQNNAKSSKTMPKVP